MSFNLNKVFKEISPMAKEIFSSFAQKGNTDNVTWLAQTLASNKHTAENAAEITETIYSTIGRFNANMQKIDQACAAGKTKEQWLKNFIENDTTLTPQEKGEYLAQAGAALNLGNQFMTQAMQDPNAIDITEQFNQLNQQALPPVPNAEWNKYTMAPVVNQIGQEAVIMGANGVMMPLNNIPQVPGGAVLQENCIEEQSGSAIDEGLKMAASAALTIGHAAGKIPFLPKNMPISAITNIACVGVESFKNIGRVVTGKITAKEAVENIGRASVAAFADFCTTGIPARVLTVIPVVGPALSFITAGFLMQCSPEYIQQKIYAGIEKVRSVANSVVESVKSAVTTVVDGIKNIVNA